ncbi:MAG: DNA double-strand break repair nuclease NurA [Candidatus Bathyarchaeia archaeon]
MSSQDLYETLKRYEFNKTEPETLQELIKSALKKGNLVKERMGKLKELVVDVEKILKRENLLLEINVMHDDCAVYRDLCAVGIDGSFQCIGGIGGIWYTPISCARIIFPNGFNDSPQVSVTAGIEDIDQHKHPNVETEASIRMLLVETKALSEWASSTSDRRSVVFIDGPIVDPPYYDENEYVKYRCDVISKCLDRDIFLIGCVKRVLGKPFINYVTNKLLKDNNEKSRLHQFTSDIHLINYVFTKEYFSGAKGVLATLPVDISEEDNVHKAYLKHGIRVFSFFMQKDAFASPIRLDIPQKLDSNTDAKSLMLEAVKTTFAWSYPGYDIPLPVVLAHNKCAVRKGCAEVLYEEILTRAASPDPFDNVVGMKLR